MAWLKYCNCSGCNQMVKQGEKYCLRHQHRGVADQKEKNKTYDRYCRNEKAKAFYHSREWINIREQILIRDNYIDLYQYAKKNKIVRANTVHHIIELSEDWSKRNVLTNLISVSEETHKMLTIAYKDVYRRLELQKELASCLILVAEQQRGGGGKKV